MSYSLVFGKALGRKFHISTGKNLDWIQLGTVLSLLLELPPKRSSFGIFE